MHDFLFIGCLLLSPLSLILILVSFLISYTLYAWMCSSRLMSEIQFLSLAQSVFADVAQCVGCRLQQCN